MNYNEDIRIDINLLENKKYRRLRKRLGPAAMEALAALWCHTARNFPDGNLVGWTEDDVDDLLAGVGVANPGAALVETRWLDKTEDGFHVHDWEQHQPYVTGAPARVEAARKAGEARWAGVDGEARQAHARRMAESRWRPGQPPAEHEMLAEGKHNASGMLAPCLPPSPSPSLSPSPNVVLQEALNPEEERLKHHLPAHARPRAGGVGAADNLMGILKENLPKLSGADFIEAWGACERCPPGWIEAAVREAVALNHPTWRYVRAILRRWERERDGPGVDCHVTLRAAAPLNDEGGTE